MLNNGRSCKNKTLKHFKTHCETLYDKPEEHILNVIVQGSDNKILLIKIVFNMKGNVKSCPLVRKIAPTIAEGCKPRPNVRGNGALSLNLR